ncbi:MAG: 3-methyl-2-oxobutanoate hydroxymethyltransferase [Hyphomicrobiaceae bacterium]|nr:3-methyl-2-oxobutanoate hydroxymethyltransferase [Hyphomicrobiaceae bacterium]
MPFPAHWPGRVRRFGLSRISLKEEIAVSTSSKAKERKKITTLSLRKLKQQQKPITMLTAYDYATAVAVDMAGIDTILVGDSLGMVVLGYENTLPVTMDDMIHHCKAVARGARYAMLIGDMPFMSYQASVDEAVRNAGRFLQEGGMDAVKLEGGRERLPAAGAIISAGIPVMGHLGLTPQSVHQLGGFKAQGKTAQAAKDLLDDALALEDAGCFSLVLETIPARLAQLVSERLEIPTIGIGAGIGCDGQVLVINDILGSFTDFVPKHAKQYAKLAGTMTNAITEYFNEVKAGTFPTDAQSFPMDESILAGLTK